MILCASDKDGNLKKQSFFPLVPTSNKAIDSNLNRFQIVVDHQPRDESDRDAKMEFVDEVLSELHTQDELACKLGSPVIQYHGRETSIRHLTLVASHLGIIPIIQLLHNILQQQREENAFDIDSIELIWINKSKDAFILNHLIEELERLYPSIFSCIRIVDKSIDDISMTLNEKVKKIIPEQEKGRVAIVAGSSIVIDKFSNTLVSNQQYDVDNVITIQE